MDGCQEEIEEARLALCATFCNLAHFQAVSCTFKHFLARLSQNVQICGVWRKTRDKRAHSCRLVRFWGVIERLDGELRIRATFVVSGVLAGDWLRWRNAGSLGAVFRLKTGFWGCALLCHFLQFRALLSKNTRHCALRGALTCARVFGVFWKERTSAHYADWCRFGRRRRRGIKRSRDRGIKLGGRKEKRELRAFGGFLFAGFLHPPLWDGAGMTEW